jgi:hypothetical protein
MTLTWRVVLLIAVGVLVGIWAARYVLPKLKTSVDDSAYNKSVAYT